MRVFEDIAQNKHIVWRYRDKRQGGHLYRYLRCQKQRKKRYGTNERRGRIASKSTEHQSVGKSHKKEAIKLEQRIEALERDKHKQELEAEQVSQLFPDIELVSERVFDFMGNPSQYWTKGDLNQKRLVQNMFFPVR